MRSGSSGQATHCAANACVIPYMKKWRFGFLQSSQPPISFLNGFFDTTDPVTCYSYIVLTTYCAPAPPQLPTSAYRFPLPAYNNATRRHAVRTNGVGLSVPQPNKPGADLYAIARYRYHRSFLKHHSIDRTVCLTPVRLRRPRRFLRENGSSCRSTPVDG
jgi:hypothetical protein